MAAVRHGKVAIAAHRHDAAGRRRDGFVVARLARAAGDAFSSRSSHVSGRSRLGFANWRPVLYAYLLWAVALGVGQVLARGERGQRALFLLAGGAVHRRDGDLPDALRPLYRLHRLESQLARRAALQRPRQSASPCSTTPISGTRSATWSIYVAGGARRNTRSPSASRCCSTPTSARASSSASPSCCPSC